VVGLSLNEVPTYAGSDRHGLRLRPLWSVQFGRFQVGTSGARSISNLGLGSTNVASGSGASVDVVDTGPWRVGVSLRIDGGRSASDDPKLAGLPEIRSTLRGRVYANRALAPGWSVGLGLSQDLLGRQGGALFNTGLGYGGRLGSIGQWSASAGLTWGDATYLRTHHGIDPASARATGRAAYQPGAGMVSRSLGTSLQVPLGPNWVVLAGAGVGQLIGPAAASPLTERRGSWQLSVGLAWRDRAR
jgi:outer membrane scaffolding protein for murein synthesis (MipA/OmpV family)